MNNRMMDRIAHEAVAAFRREQKCVPKDDMLQEARMAVYKASTTFNPGLGFAFSAYAHKAAWQHTRKFVMRELKRLLKNEDVAVAEALTAPACPEEELHAAQWRHAIFSRLEKLASPLAVDVLLGDKPRDVAAREKVPVARVYAETYQARRLVRKDKELRLLLKGAP